MLQNRLPVATAAASLAIAFAFHALHEPRPVEPPVPKNGSLSLDARLSHRAVNTQETGKIWAQIDNTGTAEAPDQERPPMELVLVFDRSGSMMGEKLHAAKQAVHTLTALMGPDDRVALVSFSDEAKLEAPLSWVGDGTVDRQVDAIVATGGTNIAAGQEAGARAFAGARPDATRMMFLVSDGEATVGDTSTETLASLAATNLQERKASLTAIGIGDGFNEVLLGELANRGGGNFYYAESAAQLAEKLQTEWRGLASAVARGIRVKLEPKNGARIAKIHGFSTQWEGANAYVYVDAVFPKGTRKMMVELDVTGAKSSGEFLDVALTYDDLTANSALRSVSRSVATALVDRPLVPSDVNLPLLARGQLVQTATVLDKSDQQWGKGSRDKSRALLSAQHRQNADFIARWGSTPDIVQAQNQLITATRNLEVIQEKRQIRIRKKRKLDTIEIITGD